MRLLSHLIHVHGARTMDTSPTTDAAVSHVATEATKLGAATGVVGWLTSTTIIALFGLLVAVLGFIINLYFQNRRDKREKEMHQLQMGRLMQLSYVDPQTTATEKPGGS